MPPRYNTHLSTKDELIAHTLHKHREPLLERTFCRINTQQHEEWWFVFAWWPLLVVEPSRYMRFAKNIAYIRQSAIFNLQSDKLTLGRWGQSGLWWTRETRRRKNHTQMEIIYKLQDKMEEKNYTFFQCWGSGSWSTRIHFIERIRVALKQLTKIIRISYYFKKKSYFL